MLAPCRPVLAAAALALVAGTTAASADSTPFTLVDEDDWVTYSWGNVDFRASGYCTGTWAVCGAYTDQMRWYDLVDFQQTVIPGDMSRMVYAPPGTELHELASVELEQQGNWAGFGHPGVGENHFLSGAGVIFASDIPGIGRMLYFADPPRFDNLGYFVEFLGDDFSEVDDLVLNYAMDVASVTGFGNSPTDPSLVPEINGSGFAYIAFILGSLALWLYSGAGRREPEAVAV